VWKDGGQGVDRTGWASNVREGKGLWSCRRRRMRGKRSRRRRKSYLLMGKLGILQFPVGLF
jgi:hypothetical protein